MDPYLTLYTKFNSNWIKDMSVRLGTIKFLEKNIKVRLLNIFFGNHFLDLTPQAKVIKAKRNNWNHIKLKSF